MERWEDDLEEIADGLKKAEERFRQIEKSVQLVIFNKLIYVS